MLAAYVKGQKLKFLIFKRSWKFLSFFYSLAMKTDEIIFSEITKYGNILLFLY